MIIDEFNIEKYDLKDLKRFLAWETLVGNVKFFDPKIILPKILCILICNYAPPSFYETKYPGLERE